MLAANRQQIQYAQNQDLCAYGKGLAPTISVAKQVLPYLTNEECRETSVQLIQLYESAQTTFLSGRFNLNYFTYLIKKTADICLKFLSYVARDCKCKK